MLACSSREKEEQRSLTRPLFRQSRIELEVRTMGRVLPVHSAAIASAVPGPLHILEHDEPEMPGYYEDVRRAQARSHGRLARSTAKLTPRRLPRLLRARRGSSRCCYKLNGGDHRARSCRREGRRDSAQPSNGSGGSSVASHAVKACGRSAEEILYELAHFATAAVRRRAFAIRAGLIKDSILSERQESVTVCGRAKNECADLQLHLALLSPPSVLPFSPPAFVRWPRKVRTCACRRGVVGGKAGAEAVARGAL